MVYETIQRVQATHLKLLRAMQWIESRAKEVKEFSIKQYGKRAGGYSFQASGEM